MGTNHRHTKRPEENEVEHEGVRRSPAMTDATYTGLLALQRSAGNEVVNRLLSGDHGARDVSDLRGDLPMKLATQQLVQPSLKVGAAHDPFEDEADRIAETVMKMSDTDVARQASSGVQRTDGLDDADVLPMRIRRTTVIPDEDAFELSGSTETGVKRVLQSGGSPLPKSERSFFESRMGYDLGAVRIHDDKAAAQASQTINAKAFTVGGDIAFGDGAYQPGTPGGRKLLAHELAHVVQQGAAGVQPKRRPEDER
jgi:hypothetical protein